MSRHVEGDRLSAWISGELSDRDTAVVRAHVETCGPCSDVAAALSAQVSAMRVLERPEPPPTLWPAIEGALETSERLWSWRSGLAGAFAGAVVVALVGWGVSHVRLQVRMQAHVGGRAGDRTGDSAGATVGGDTAGAIDSVAAVAGPVTGTGLGAPPVVDPLFAEAELELQRAATSYEEAVARLRRILDHEQAAWDPETRARVGDRLARLDEAVAHSRAVARRDPGDASGADMLFSAYRRQIDFLAEAVHRGSPAGGGGVR
ncbi:MAG: zf-HC2 domain-containing protein [Pseudomonadota bacterium]